MTNSPPLVLLLLLFPVGENFQKKLFWYSTTLSSQNYPKFWSCSCFQSRVSRSGAIHVCVFLPHAWKMDWSKTLVTRVPILFPPSWCSSVQVLVPSPATWSKENTVARWGNSIYQNAQMSKHSQVKCTLTKVKMWKSHLQRANCPVKKHLAQQTSACELQLWQKRPSYLLLCFDTTLITLRIELISMLAYRFGDTMIFMESYCPFLTSGEEIKGLKHQVSFSDYTCPQ